MLFSTGRINETIELQAQVMALEPRAIFVSRDQQFNLYAAGRFDEVEAEYQRSRTLDGNHTGSDLLAFTRGWHVRTPIRRLFVNCLSAL